MSVLQHLPALFSAYLFYISQQFQELNSLYLSRITRLRRILSQTFINNKVKAKQNNHKFPVHILILYLYSKARSYNYYVVHQRLGDNCCISFTCDANKSAVILFLTFIVVLCRFFCCCSILNHNSYVFGTFLLIQMRDSARCYTWQRIAMRKIIAY